MEEKNTRRSGVRIMGQLIGLVRPLLWIMAVAVVMGILGYLCAIFLTITAVEGILKLQFRQDVAVSVIGGILPDTVGGLGVVLVALAVMRGVLHYIEQYCNHYIAFRLLAVIRHKVFAALRRLCPAKLEGKEKGNLISVITSDIELLEVFYAHTISPIMIAFFTSVLMIIFLCKIHFTAGVIAFFGYLAVGVILPLWNAKRGKNVGMDFREKFGHLSSFVLDSLRGIDETMQYAQGEKRSKDMQKYSYEMEQYKSKLAQGEGRQRAGTNVVIYLFTFIMFGSMAICQQNGMVSSSEVVLCTIAMMGSFGPVVALSNLSNNLTQTLASGERVLRILEEIPVTNEISGKTETTFGDVICNQVEFGYDTANKGQKVISNCNVVLKPGNIYGILGPSGSGKSTLLKLIMRFWNVNQGSITINGRNVNDINTSNLRNMQAYMTQETWLFHDSIASNISLGRDDVKRADIIEAAKKASIHDMIMELPKGYDTQVGELGSTLSGGEKQRIGLARMFLSQGEFWLLDEPTSNLDSLNEGIILKALQQEAKERTVLMVSHRKSTLGIVKKENVLHV